MNVVEQINKRLGNKSFEAAYILLVIIGAGCIGSVVYETGKRAVSAISEKLSKEAC